MFFADPPWDRESLPVYNELAKLAFAKLKPGGWLDVTFAPVENITPESGREIEPRTYLQEEDGEPLLHHYVLPEEIDGLLAGFTMLEKRLEPRVSRDASGHVTRRLRWNVLGQRV